MTPGSHSNDHLIRFNGEQLTPIEYKLIPLYFVFVCWISLYILRFLFTACLLIFIWISSLTCICMSWFVLTGCTDFQLLSMIHRKRPLTFNNAFRSLFELLRFTWRPQLFRLDFHLLAVHLHLTGIICIGLRFISMRTFTSFTFIFKKLPFFAFWSSVDFRRLSFNFHWFVMLKASFTPLYVESWLTRQDDYG